MHANFLWIRSYFLLTSILALSLIVLIMLCLPQEIDTPKQLPPLSKKPFRIVRQDVSKEIWRMDQGTRRHHLLQSGRSSCFILPQKKHAKTIETLQSVFCSIEGHDGLLMTVSADKSFFSPSSLLMKNFGHIVIQGTMDGKATCALGDTMVIDFKNKKGELNGTPEHRVLLSQDGMEMSSEKILFNQGIQSMGITHFSFNQEEKELMKRFFKS